MALPTIVTDLIGRAFEPLTRLIDELHTSSEEKGALRLAVAQSQIEFAGRVLDYEKGLVEAQAKIVEAEAKGDSWLQRSWRPVTMLTFLALVVCDSFGLLSFRLAAEAWTLLQLGLGGYVVGRSAEKVIPGLAAAIGRDPIAK